MTRFAPIPVALAVSAAVVAAASAPAGAATLHPAVAITGGSSHITLSKSTLKVLKANHFKLTAVSPTTFNGKTLASPITSGTFSLTSATVQTAGGITISKGGKHITISRLRSDSGSGTGTAKVSGHGRIKAVTTTAPTSISGTNPVTASGYTVTMAAPLVKILDKKFNTQVFKHHPKLGPGSVTLKF